jgi:hypothetical protein
MGSILGCIDNCIDKVLNTGIGAKRSNSKKRKKEMTKNETVSINFHFENGATRNDLKRIVRKVNTVCNNSKYQTIVSYFSNYKEIEVVITFIDASYRIGTEMNSALTRLIDSHKDSATYGWSLNVVGLVNEKVSA